MLTSSKTMKASCFNEAAPKRGRKGVGMAVAASRQLASMRPPPNGGGRAWVWFWVGSGQTPLQ